MTRERCLEIREAFNAFCDGVEVQCRIPQCPFDPWTTMPEPRWADHCEYRVKPKPRELFVNEYANGAFGNTHVAKLGAHEEARACTTILITTHRIELPPLP